jgi:hypothetical protein
LKYNGNEIKTSVQKNTLEPTWEESLIGYNICRYIYIYIYNVFILGYSINLINIENDWNCREIIFEVWDKDGYLFIFSIIILFYFILFYFFFLRLQQR